MKLTAIKTSKAVCAAANGGNPTQRSSSTGTVCTAQKYKCRDCVHRTGVQVQGLCVPHRSSSAGTVCTAQEFKCRDCVHRTGVQVQGVCAFANSHPSTDLINKFPSSP
jgi:hypothetical protein